MIQPRCSDALLIKQEESRGCPSSLSRASVGTEVLRDSQWFSYHLGPVFPRNVSTVSSSGIICEVVNLC